MRQIKLEMGSMFYYKQKTIYVLEKRFSVILEKHCRKRKGSRVGHKKEGLVIGQINFCLKLYKIEK